RIGYLDSGTASGSALLWDAFRQELSKLGWIEGKNIIIESRFAGGRNDSLPGLAAELVRLKIDLIVVPGVQSARAAGESSHQVRVGRAREKHMKKKITVLSLCAMLFAVSFRAEAQQLTKVPRIGHVLAAPPAAVPARTEAFRQGLYQLGYVEG